ncbi:MAG: 2Fe-2S iron-sulfur cluster-binding protein [Bdellovibrionota bacterium]
MEKVPSNEVLGKQVKVTVLDKQGKIIDEFTMRGGMNLWVFLRKRGLPIGSACSGVGVCAACDVKIKELSENSISIKNDFEKESLQRNNKPTECRLACLCRVYNDVEVQADYW